MNSTDIANRIYSYLYTLIEKIREISTVEDSYFILLGDTPPSPELRDFPLWESVEEICQYNNKFLSKIAVETTSKERLTIITSIHWRDYHDSLYALHPETTNISQLEILYAASKYSLVVLNDNSRQVFAIDSASHHPEIAETFPHHRHEMIPRRGMSVRKDPGIFRTHWDDMMRYLEGYLY